MNPKEHALKGKWKKRIDIANPQKFWDKKVFLMLLM